MNVIDIMEPLSNWLTPEMSISDAIQTMHQARRAHGLSPNAIVVLDGDRRLVGIVSTTDILRAIVPSGMFMDGSLHELPLQELKREKAEQLKSIRISQIMTEDVRFVKTTDSIMRCSDRLLSEHLRRLPVIGLDGRVVGTVYIRDIYNTMISLLCEPDTAMV